MQRSLVLLYVYGDGVHGVLLACLFACVCACVCACGWCCCVACLLRLVRVLVGAGVRGGGCGDGPGTEDVGGARGRWLVDQHRRIGAAQSRGMRYIEQDVRRARRSATTVTADVPARMR